MYMSLLKVTGASLSIPRPLVQEFVLHDLISEFDCCQWVRGSSHKVAVWPCLWTETSESVFLSSDSP